MRPRTRRILRRTSVRFIASCRHVRMPSACSRRIMRSNTSRIFRRCNRFILKFVAHNAKRMWTARSDASPSSRSARLHASVSCIVRTAAACCATMTAAMWVSQRRHAANSSVRRSRPRTLIAIDAARAWAGHLVAKNPPLAPRRRHERVDHAPKNATHLALDLGPFHCLLPPRAHAKRLLTQDHAKHVPCRFVLLEAHHGPSPKIPWRLEQSRT